MALKKKIQNMYKKQKKVLVKNTKYVQNHTS